MNWHLSNNAPRRAPAAGHACRRGAARLLTHATLKTNLTPSIPAA